MNTQKIKARVVRMTPKKAADLLKLNSGNRRLSAPIVARYAADMNAGNWRLNGQPVIFNGERLLDGQHRLAAVVESGKTVDLLMVTGVQTPAVGTIDTGKPRRFADVLFMNGHNAQFVLSGAVNLIGMWESISNGNGGTFGSNKYGLTHSQLSEVLARHPDVEVSVALAVSASTSIVSPTVMAFCHYLFAKKDGKAADQFLTALCSGDEVKAKSP